MNIKTFQKIFDEEYQKFRTSKETDKAYIEKFNNDDLMASEVLGTMRQRLLVYILEVDKKFVPYLKEKMQQRAFHKKGRKVSA